MYADAVFASNYFIVNSEIFNFIILILYTYLYILNLMVLLTFNLNISGYLNKILPLYSSHNRVGWFILWNVLIGTPPFFIFLSKIFLFSYLLGVKNYIFLFLLIFLNVLLFYIYLQNIIFLKKSNSFFFIPNFLKKSKLLLLYNVQLWVLYLNIGGIIFFPLLCGLVCIIL